MKPFFLILLIVLLPIVGHADVDEKAGIELSTISEAAGQTLTSISEMAGLTIAALTCQSYTANTTADTTEAIFRYATEEYYGIIFDDGSSGSICGLDLYIWDMLGTPANLDLYAEVWLLDGSDGLDTLIQRSDKVDGSAWSQELVSFTFSTPAAYDCSGTNQYGLVFKAVANDAAASTAGAVSATDYARTRYDASENTMTHNVARAKWNSSTDAIDTKQTAMMPYMTVRTMQ